MHSEHLISICDAFSAIVYGYPSSWPRAQCTPNKSVTTLRYTRRHGPVYIQAMPVGTYRVQSPGFPKIVYYSYKYNNNNEYSECLTHTGPKRLHVLYKYILSKFNKYNKNTHTHMHAHKDLHTYYYELSEINTSNFRKPMFLNNNVQEHTHLSYSNTLFCLCVRTQTFSCNKKTV